MIALGIMHFHKTVFYTKEKMVGWSILCTSVLDQVVAEIVSFLNSMGKRGLETMTIKTTLQSSVAEEVIKDAKKKNIAKDKNARIVQTPVH